MPVTPADYKERVSNLKTMQKVVLENYKQSLINYKADPTPDNKDIFEKNQNELETKLYNNLFILQNDVNKSISQNNEIIEKDDINIDNSEEKYNNKMKLLQEIRGTQLASTPFKKQIQTKMIEEYLYLGYYSLAIIAGFVFLYKH